MHKTQLTLLKLNRINFIIFHIYLEFSFLLLRVCNELKYSFLWELELMAWRERGPFEVFLLLFITVIMSYYRDIKFIVHTLS